MMDLVIFTLGGLTGLVLWWLVVGPLFHGFMDGLMELPVRSGAAASPDAPRAVEARANKGFTVASPAVVGCATRIVVGTKTSAHTLSI